MTPGIGGATRSARSTCPARATLPGLHLAPEQARFRSNALALGLAWLLLLGAAGDSVVSGQEEAPQTDDQRQINYVELASVSAKFATKKDEGGAKRDTWKLTVAGKATRLPPGTVVRIEAKYSLITVAEFQLTIDASKRFRTEFEFEHTGYAKGLFLRTEVDYAKQPTGVQQYMRSKPEEFWLDFTPWPDTFPDHRFDLGEGKDLERQAKEVKGFFEEKIKAVHALEAKLVKEVAAAKNKSSYQKGDKFDESLWQRVMEKEIRDELRKFQKQIAAAKKTLKFYLVERDLNYLQEIVNTLAGLSLRESKAVHKHFGVPLAESDVAPKDLDINARQKASPRFLRKRVEQLCESQELQNPFGDSGGRPEEDEEAAE